jgi:hypothetical protein
MAEAVTEGVLQIGQNEENYLEFDLGEGHSERADPATNDIAADREQMNATATDDFDVQFDELDEGGDPAYFEPSHTVFGDVQNGKLGGPHDNRAVSEIDYNESEEEEEEEEEDKPDQPAADSTVSHGSVDNDNADGTTEFFGKDDEISYDDTDLEAIQTTTGALETRAAPGPEVDAGANEQEANVLDRSQQGNTVASDTYGDVPESEQHHVDDGQSPKACAAEEPVQEGNTPIDQSVENEHSGAHFDHGWSEDHQQTAHGVIATYKGREYELFASPTNSDPETYFFASTEELYCPLSQMFHGIRDILGAELHPTDELLLAVEDLDLVIGSVSLSGTGDSKADANILQSSNEEFLEETTMHDILNLYLQLQLNDGVTDEPTLFVQLMARPPCEERFRFLKNAAQEGRGLTEFYDSPADSDMDIDMDLASGHHSDEESVGDAVTSADELGDKGNGDVADMEDVQEAFSLYGTNGIDEHAEEGEDLLEGDLEADITSVPEHPNGKGPSIDDGDVAEASPEEGGQASNQAEEAPADQYFNGGNEQGDVTDDGDNHDSANEPGASTAVRQGSDLDLAGAMEPSDENGQDEAGEGLEDGVERVGSGDVASDSFTAGLQVEADGDIRQEAGIDVEYSSAVATLDEEVAHDDALDDDGEVDYLLTNDDVPNDDLAAADDFGQVTDSKTTSNTSTLQGDVDEIDYNEDAAHADELDLHLDAVNDAPANDVDEIDWNHDGDEGDANGDLSTTNNTSPESSAKRFRDADDGSSLDAENGTPAKRQKL